jgi:hypothetical protein
LQLQDRYDRARGRVRTPRVVAFFDLNHRGVRSIEVDIDRLTEFKRANGQAHEGRKPETLNFHSKSDSLLTIVQLYVIILPFVKHG